MPVFMRTDVWLPLWKSMTAQAARLYRNEGGQDLVEYALLAGFVAVAAGALLPGISTSISTIFSRMASVLTAASS
ncbi:MAG TPA: Flp family type IVb pilin [Bryobacterales bacterium]|jgi:pilus assembly protein Flp/PilA|nr:Flp family type IVb pilin [Bryobacterales bacterium]